MAERSTLARPYARAVFELARDSTERKKWAEGLSALATLVQDQQLQPLLDHPSISASQLAGIVTEALGELSEQEKNFVHLLAENRRLGLADEVYRIYETLRAEAENRISVEVVTAKALEDEQQKRLSEALRQRVGKEIELRTRVDESLIGGAVIKAGDTTIDGSVKGKLARLSSALVY
ncbi:F0F1 ATP synthase subunit delta [Halorhodospira halochloris]|uniref:F0F1 ATP synthase subunit delta n=1 Tax=Halorhodospira halochloris TaxID=1052 RepID=UPI001EE7B0C9|nr:F0F1 ATP synthase subunit delta [Halorhodospira halochloris]MCG5530284.1 F0F1 ATP synthase subunit delta [Halorhodospira halochloris]MCG5547199.1 F0F1 ATP synthase subunit delta [Halorhodospira halochloris]